jgi:hypothetical protein
MSLIYKRKNGNAIHDFGKASKESEAEIMPSEKILDEMGKPTRSWREPACCSPRRDCIRASRARASDSREKRIVTDGPFAENKDLVAGF